MPSRVTAILAHENNRCVVSIACVASVSTGEKRLLYFSGRERIRRASLPIFRAAQTIKIFHSHPPSSHPPPHTETLATQAIIGTFLPFVHPPAFGHYTISIHISED